MKKFILNILILITIIFIPNIVNAADYNYTIDNANLLKETTEAAMYDAIDQVEYQKNGNIKINAEKFIENFIRRYAENASLSSTYVIEIYHISEYPPKVSLLVKSSESTNATGEILEFDITNRIDAILETPY